MTSKTRDDFGIAPLRRTLIRAEQFLSNNTIVPEFTVTSLVFGRMLLNYHVAFTAALST